MWSSSVQTEAVYGLAAPGNPPIQTQQAQQAQQQAQQKTFATLRLLGDACQSLDNRPFVCRNLVAYSILYGPNWAQMLARALENPIAPQPVSAAPPAQ